MLWSIAKRQCVDLANALVAEIIRKRLKTLRGGWFGADMNALTGRGPYQKQEKLRPDPAYLEAVRNLPCRVCNRYPCEAHHCRDLPDFNDDIYKQLPGAGRKSHDHDAIPLCPQHHRMFHLERPKFHEAIGKDYTHIKDVRELVKCNEDDDILGDWF